MWLARIWPIMSSELVSNITTHSCSRCISLPIFMLKSDAHVSGLLHTFIKNSITESVFPPGGFPVFSPSRIAFLASSLQVWMGNTLTLYAVCIGILSLKIKWSDREENNPFFCVLRFTLIENLHPIYLLVFMSWCSNLILVITLLLCFEVIYFRVLQHTTD
jgi:hypothetical protein